MKPLSFFSEALLILGALLAGASFCLPTLAHDEDDVSIPPALPVPAARQSEMRTKLHPDLIMHLEEMQRYQDPQRRGRAAAVEKAQQRRDRISAAKWYGHTPLRPNVSSIPSMGNYYPLWNTDVWRPAQWYHIHTWEDLD